MLSLTVCWVIFHSLLLALLNRRGFWVWFIDDIPAMRRKAGLIKEKRRSAGVNATSQPGPPHHFYGDEAHSTPNDVKLT